jgi:hypothetical protein
MPSLGDIFTPQVRQYLYLVITAAVPLLVTRGILDSDDVYLWLGLATAVLGTGTAAVNVRRQRKDGTLPATPEAPPPGG